jgi:hypothetical protein
LQASGVRYGPVAAARVMSFGTKTPPSELGSPRRRLLAAD